MQEDAGGIDHRRIGGGDTGAECVEDLVLEGLGRIVDSLPGNLTGADSLPEPVDGDPARLHDRGVAVVIDRVPKIGKVEEAMDCGNASIIGCHG